MLRCPRCLHGELTDLKEPGPIIKCNYCGYRDYSSNILKYNNISLNLRYIISIYKEKKIICFALFLANLIHVISLNPRYKYRIFCKNKIICVALSLANLIYVIPMFMLFVITFALIVVLVLGPVIPEYPIVSEKYTILVTFFIMLGIVDLSILVLHRYVYKHINNLILDLNELAPEYFSDSREIIIKREMDKPNESKLYPERLLIFGVVIILLDFAYKLLTDEVPDLKIILVGISMVLISIGIWKYLSFKADEFDRNSK